MLVLRRIIIITIDNCLIQYLRIYKYLLCRKPYLNNVKYFRLLFLKLVYNYIHIHIHTINTTNVGFVVVDLFK